MGFPLQEKPKKGVTLVLSNISQGGTLEFVIKDGILRKYILYEIVLFPPNIYYFTNALCKVTFLFCTAPKKFSKSSGEVEECSATDAVIKQRSIL